jgi:hypothetical protein
MISKPNQSIGLIETGWNKEGGFVYFPGENPIRAAWKKEKATTWSAMACYGWYSGTGAIARQTGAGDDRARKWLASGFPIAAGPQSPVLVEGWRDITNQEDSWQIVGKLWPQELKTRRNLDRVRKLFLATGNRGGKRKEKENKSKAKQRRLAESCDWREQSTSHPDFQIPWECTLETA